MDQDATTVLYHRERNMNFVAVTVTGASECGVDGQALAKLLRVRGDTVTA